MSNEVISMLLWFGFLGFVWTDHSSEEDQHGRLSMWRAYGGVGRSGRHRSGSNWVFKSETDALGAYSSPVAYLTPGEFAAEFTKIARRHRD